jgi:hypothetical protein
MDDPLKSPYDLTGLVDLHIHSAPDVHPRFGDDIDIVSQARQAGMRAVLLKSHVAPTPDRAAIAEKVVGGIRVFGGLALNEAVGGFNPAAVEVALQLGAKEIWMPTRSAAHLLRREGKPGGLTVLEESGELRPVVLTILDLVAQADAILATGHLSPGESAVLVPAALQRGVRKVLVTHPEADFIRMPLDLQAALAREGAYFERCFVDTTSMMSGAVSLEDIAHAIRTVGVPSTVLATDFGQPRNPAPVQGMQAYLSGLVGLGFGRSEIQRMAGETPAQLLGL